MATTDTLIYVGPTLSGYRLIKYQTFIGGIPDYLNDILADHPTMKHLFVPVNKLNDAEQKIKKLGTPLNKYYKLAMEV